MENKYNKTQLEEFIANCLRQKSPKTGRDIKINTWHKSKCDLEAIITKANAWKYVEEYYGNEIKEPEVKFTKAELHEAGYQVASLYGGFCDSIKKIAGGYRFNCSEHGEKFYSDLTYKEINELLGK